MGSALLSVEILNVFEKITRVGPTTPATIVVDLPHPRPGQDIQIRRASSRLHTHTGNQTSSGLLLLELRRVSDDAILSFTSTNLAVVRFAQEEILVSPDFFVLNADDSLRAELSAFGKPGDSIVFNARSTIVFNVVDPRFVSITVLKEEEAVLGLKDDGSVWKATNAKTPPLLWVQV